VNLVCKQILHQQFLRLNVLGFLTLENDESPGNLGVRDVALALKWIKKNIRHFGGDANKVTLGGFGSGGSIAVTLMLSPIGQGLMHRVCHIMREIAMLV